MYQKNSYVVYRKDVCQIQDIVKRKMDEKEVYQLIPLKDNSLKIEVPVDSDLLRPVISKEETKKLIESIPNIHPLTEIQDKYIESEYRNHLQNGTYSDLITIIKTTYLRNQKRKEEKKKPSEKDIYYFELAEQYLYQEFAVALDMTTEDVKQYIIQTIQGSKQWTN